MERSTIFKAVLIGVWVSAYAFLQKTVSAYFGLAHTELWPALLAPAMVHFLGAGKKGTRKYYQMFSAGIASAMLCVFAEHLLHDLLGSAGPYLALALFITAIFLLGRALPSWFGAGALVAFTISMAATNDILLLTVMRLVALLAGATLFMWVEHRLCHAVDGFRPAAKPAEANLRQLPGQHHVCEITDQTGQGPIHKQA